MKLGFNYKEYNKFEKVLSSVEEKIIKDQFEIVIAGNDSFEDKSSPEVGAFFWIFRHGWICRSMIV